MACTGRPVWTYPEVVCGLHGRFLTHRLTMETGQQVRAKKLFPTFGKYLDQTDRSTKEILEDIDYYASIYEEITAPDQVTREGVFFHRLNVLDTTTPYPVLLWIFGHDDCALTQRMRQGPHNHLGCEQEKPV